MAGASKAPHYQGAFMSIFFLCLFFVALALIGIFYPETFDYIVRNLIFGEFAPIIILVGALWLLGMTKAI